MIGSRRSAIGLYLNLWGELYIHNAIQVCDISFARNILFNNE